MYLQRETQIKIMTSSYTCCMSKGDPIPPVPGDAPMAGETYKHHKGDIYRVINLALDSNTDEWVVVYEPMYENPAAKLFVRPLKEWSEGVEWQGEKMRRFEKM